MKKRNIIVLKIIIIIIINIFLCNIIGKLYLKKFNKFIEENNQILIKKEINNIVRSNYVNISSDLYNIIYNDKNEIVNIDLNANDINKYLSSYLSIINDKLNNTNYKYLNKYYNLLKTNNKTYFLLPIGIISDNPLFFNTGPKIILYYDLLNIPTIKVVVKLKNYGLNNALIETYLLIHVDQSVLKPILTTVSTYEYSFLVSSKMINGRVSSFLGTNLSFESDAISS